MRVLFLSHRIPFPPDKGDKIRSYRLLEALAARHEVRLITHADDPRDLRHLPALLEHLPQGQRLSRVGRRAPLAQRGRAAPRTSDLVRAASTTAARRDEVRQAIETERPDVVVVFSAQPAEYLPADTGVPVVVDLVDVDSEKWTAYAESARGPMRWIYRREARLVRAFERKLAGAAARISVATDREAAEFHASVSDREVATVIERRRDPSGAGGGARPRGSSSSAARWTTQPNRERLRSPHGPCSRSCRRRRPHARLRIIGRNPGRRRARARAPSGRRGQRRGARRRARDRAGGSEPAAAADRARSSEQGARVVRVRRSGRGDARRARGRRRRSRRARARRRGRGRPRRLRRPAAPGRALRRRIGEGGRELATGRFRWDCFESGMLGLLEEAVHGGLA